MKNAKIILIIILVIAALLLILQNTGYVRVTLFFFRLEMPMIILLLVTLGLGFLIGLLVAVGGRPRLKK